MSSYTKLFSHIITSSVWSEDDQTRILWITFLALSDKFGEVQASIPGLAKVSNLSIDAVKLGIHKLSSPDEYSRTKDEEGRRIAQIDGGWHIINYDKHRKMASKDEQRAKAAIRQKRWRERQKRNGSVTNVDVTVTPVDALVTHQLDIAEADAEADAKKNGRNGTETRGDIGQEFDISEMAPDAQVAELKRLFPDIDIHSEFEKLKKRCSQSNTTPTIRSFIGWLKKASPRADIKKPKSDRPTINHSYLQMEKIR